MNERLLVAVMGERNSGKSTTWNRLFGTTVRTSKNPRPLRLSEHEWVNVFLVSGSPEERQEYVGDIIKGNKPDIVLCSLQYRKDVTDSLDYFAEQGYHIFLHWLNPGYEDRRKSTDSLGIVPYVLGKHSLVGVRDGTVDPEPRVDELRSFIRGWAGTRGLLRTEA